MPEIKPDLSDPNRCISVHWSIPVQCVLHRTHAENWHEAWHPGTGNRIRYDRASHSYLTEELRGGEWHDLRIPAPGDVCGEPHSSKAGVFCQDPITHNQTSWTHSAIVDGCRYTWNTLRRDLTPGQVQQDMTDFRRLADEQAAEIERLRAELAEALRILDDGPQMVNDRVMQHASVPATRAADVLRATLAHPAAPSA